MPSIASRDTATKRPPREDGALPVWPFAAVLGLCAVLGLGKQLWYDEAYTLLCYVSTGPLYSLTHYQAPNNHVLFSALLGALPLPHVEPAYRAVSVAAAAAAVAAMLLAAARLAPDATARSRAVAVLGVLLAFPSFLSFATQVRGYALSIALLASCVLALLAAWRGERRWPAPLYGISAALAVATVPTNLIPLAALGLADLLAWRRTGAGRRGLASLALRHGTAACGALVYLPTWRQVAAQAARGWAWQSPAEWLGDLALAVLLPALLVPSVRLLAGPAPRPGRSGPGPAGLLAGAGAAVVAGLAAGGAHLFPRSFAGFIPIAVAVIVAAALRAGAGRPAAVWTAALLTAAIGQAYWHAGTRWLWDDGRPLVARRLLPPYFEATGFDPAEAAAAAAAAGGDRFLVLVDNRDRFSDEMSVWYYAALAGHEASFVLGPRNLPPPAFPLGRLPVLLVSRDAAGRDGLLVFLGRPDARWRAVKPHGHFKVWRLEG